MIGVPLSEAGREVVRSPRRAKGQGPKVNCGGVLEGRGRLLRLSPLGGCPASKLPLVELQVNR